MSVPFSSRRLTKMDLRNELRSRYEANARDFINVLNTSEYPAASIDGSTLDSATASFIATLNRASREECLNVFEVLAQDCPISSLFGAVHKKLKATPAYVNFFNDILGALPKVELGAGETSPEAFLPPTKETEARFTRAESMEKPIPNASPARLNPASGSKPVCAARRVADMRILTWLHITDFHYGLDPSGTHWAIAQECFFKDLKYLVQKRRVVPDIIFFTGDHVQAGAKAEFKGLNSEISRVYEKLREFGVRKDPILISVPGNHDLVRPLSTDPSRASTVLKNLDHTPRARRTFWNDATSSSRRAVAGAFANYVNWEKRHPHPRADRKKGILPGEFVSSLEVNGIRVGILGLNTACGQLAKGSYEGRLTADSVQITVLKPDLHTWNEEHKVRFVLSHHPPQWLSEMSLEIWNTEIAPAGRFQVHLFGHMHENSYTNVGSGGAEPRKLFQGVSLLGLEAMGSDGRASERSHGYAMGQIKVTKSGSWIRFWPRRVDVMRGVKWRALPDPTFDYDPATGATPWEHLHP